MDCELSYFVYHLLKKHFFTLVIMIFFFWSIYCYSLFFISSNQTKTNLFNLIGLWPETHIFFHALKHVCGTWTKFYKNFFSQVIMITFFFNLVHLLSLPIFLCHLIKIKLTYLTQSGLWSKLQNYLHALKCVCGTWTSFFTQNNLIT
jgi:hypothetical protein